MGSWREGQGDIRRQTWTLKNFESRREMKTWVWGGGGKTAIHLWLSSHYEKERCERCGVANKRLEWANIKGHNYTRNREDYAVFCVSCHRLFDRNNLCMKGLHELTENNTVQLGPGRRRCGSCLAQYQKRTADRRREYHREYSRTYKRPPPTPSQREAHRARSRRYYYRHRERLLAERKILKLDSKREGVIG